MLCYVKLFSGKVYSYDASTINELTTLLGRELGVRSNYIRILNKGGDDITSCSASFPLGKDAVQDDKTFYAFVEEPKVIDHIYLEVSKNGEFYISRPFHKLFSNSFIVFIDESKFTKEVIENFKLELWELVDYDTRDMSLSQLAQLYVEKVSKMKVESVIILNSILNSVDN